jgi:hypothetical protein
MSNVAGGDKTQIGPISVTLERGTWGRQRQGTKISACLCTKTALAVIADLRPECALFMKAETLNNWPSSVCFTTSLSLSRTFDQRQPQRGQIFLAAAMYILRISLQPSEKEA